MAEEGAKASTKKDQSDVARIRENQRRSRARRKEYLRELESRWRNCQQTGAQANVEIQAAARQVLQENKRLRALLRSKGVSEQEIEMFNPAQLNGQYDASLDLQTSPVDYAVAGPLPPSTVLDAMLNLAKPCDEEKCPAPSADAVYHVRRVCTDPVAPMQELGIEQDNQTGLDAGLAFDDLLYMSPQGDPFESLPAADQLLEEDFTFK